MYKTSTGMLESSKERVKNSKMKQVSGTKEQRGVEQKLEVK